MNLHRNKKTGDCDIYNRYTLTVRNKFDNIQETSKKYTPSDGYENFDTAHLEAAVTYVASKSRAKYKASWEPIAVWGKLNHLKNHPY